MNLQIYDGAGHLIVDNGPTHAVRKMSDRYIDDAISNPQKNPLPAAVQGNESSEFSYYRIWTSKDGKIIICAFPSGLTKKRALYRSYRNSSWPRSSSA